MLGARQSRRCTAPWRAGRAAQLQMPGMRGVSTCMHAGAARSKACLVVCEVELPQGRPIHWATEPVPHRLGYWPRGEVTAQLRALRLDTIDHGLLQHALVTYEAGTELVALMLASAEPTIVQLRRMRITPAECHRQVQRRRSEFCGVGR